MFLHISCCLETFHKPFNQICRFVTFVITSFSSILFNSSYDYLNFPNYTFRHGSTTVPPSSLSLMLISPETHPSHLNKSFIDPKYFLPFVRQRVTLSDPTNVMYALYKTYICLTGEPGVGVPVHGRSHWFGRRTHCPVYVVGATDGSSHDVRSHRGHGRWFDCLAVCRRLKTGWSGALLRKYRCVYVFEHEWLRYKRYLLQFLYEF